MKVKIWPFGLGYLHGGGAEDLLDLHLVVSALPSIWKPAIRESREARLEAALVFNKPSEELVDFFRVAACFLADFALKGPFLVELVDFFGVQPSLQQPPLQQPSLQQPSLQQAACFLADLALKGPFLVFLARLFLNTFPVPFFFMGLDFFDRATCFFDFCIFTGILAAFMEEEDIFLVLLLARLFFSTSCTLLEEGLLEFSIFAVQGAADLTSVFFKGQSWNEQRTQSNELKLDLSCCLSIFLCPTQSYFHEY